MPEEIPALALALNVSVDELFREHLMVDYWVRYDKGYNNIYLLAPRILGRKAGSFYPEKPTGACAWFKNGKCSIHLQGKPSECRQLRHGPDGEYLPIDRKAIAMAWDKPEHRAFIARLIGKDPGKAQFHIFDEDTVCQETASAAI